MKKTLPITTPVLPGQILYHSNRYLGHHYFIAVDREGSEVTLRACTEKGEPTVKVTQVALRDSRLVHNEEWRRVE